MSDTDVCSRTVYVLQERGWSYVARGVYETEQDAHDDAAVLGLLPGGYEIDETQMWSRA